MLHTKKAKPVSKGFFASGGLRADCNIISPQEQLAWEQGVAETILIITRRARLVGIASRNTFRFTQLKSRPYLPDTNL